MHQQTSAHAWQRPAAVWGVVLAAIFVTEYMVMLGLPWVLPETHPRVVEAIVDAIVLTAVIAPVVWWTTVRPFRAVDRLRARFLTQVLDRIEADRRRTALELHDGIGQSLSVLVSGLRSSNAAGDANNDRVGTLLEVAQNALRDVKRLARGLRPSLLDDLGLVPALERLIADISENHPVKLTLDASDLAGRRLPEAIETTVFRIIQEALANVVTHSLAQSATVIVQQRTGKLMIRVTDDGRGIVEPQKSTGQLGLSGMRERATLLGGTFSMHAPPGQGTRIVVTIPIGDF